MVATTSYHSCHASPCHNLLGSSVAQTCWPFWYPAQLRASRNVSFLVIFPTAVNDPILSITCICSRNWDSKLCWSIVFPTLKMVTLGKRLQAGTTCCNHWKMVDPFWNFGSISFQDLETKKLWNKTGNRNSETIGNNSFFAASPYFFSRSFWL